MMVKGLHLLILLALLTLPLTACTVDINQQRYSCTTNSDCASGYSCQPVNASTTNPVYICMRGIPDAIVDVIDTPDEVTDCGLCEFAGGYGECLDGTCVLAGCVSGYDDCNTDPTDGCEVDLTSDSLNCGTCDTACTASNAVSACVAAPCKIDCEAGWGDCNNDITDGCERDLTSDAANCGQCNLACAAPAGTCDSSQCVCEPGTALEVIGLNPAQHSTDADGSALIADFNCPVDPGSLAQTPIAVSASLQGTGSTSALLLDPTRLELTPSLTFLAGEEVSLTLTSGLKSLYGGAALLPIVWSFRIAASSLGTGSFGLDTRDLGTSAGTFMELIDVDGDGDLDLVRFEMQGSGAIWTNDGDGTFTDGQMPFADQTYPSGGAINDVNGDGAPDLLIYGFSGSTIWLNDGAGVLHDSGVVVGSASESAPASVFGDFDRDGDADLALLGYTGGVELWSNDGASFTLQGTSASTVYITALDAGDLDNDGDVDLYLTTGSGADVILLNDGAWAWTELETTQTLSAEAVKLGDLDGDGDLDAVVGGFQSEAVLWLNAGDGTSTTTPTFFSDGPVSKIEFADFDGDGDLDVLLVRSSSNSAVCAPTSCQTIEVCGDGIDNNCDTRIDEPGCSSCYYSELLRNASAGRFTTMATFPNPSNAVSIGDVDGDGDIDILFAGYDGSDELWLND